MIMKYTLFLILIIMATGCGTTEETKTVDYYKENASERKSKIKECQNNPGELSKTPNCMNAKKASFDAFNTFDVKKYENSTSENSVGRKW